MRPRCVVKFMRKSVLNLCGRTQGTGVCGWGESDAGEVALKWSFEVS